MNDLPDSAPGGVTSNTQSPTSQRDDSAGGQTTAVSSPVGKEVEASGVRSPEIGLKDVSGQEVDLPKEVAVVGVTVQPTSVAIPPKVSALGVKPSGPGVPLGTGDSVVLPLTNEKIAQGLHRGVTNSFRWLAEWCKRKLKQIHMSIRGTK